LTIQKRKEALSTKFETIFKAKSHIFCPNRRRISGKSLWKIQASEMARTSVTLSPSLKLPKIALFI